MRANALPKGGGGLAVDAATHERPRAQLIMSLSQSSAPLTEDDFREWLESLGLTIPGEGREDQPFRDLIKDGVLLCQLVNKIRPGSVDIVSLSHLYESRSDVRNHR